MDEDDDEDDSYLRFASGMLAAAMQSAGIADLIDVCLSVDELQAFKAVPAVYAMVKRRFGVAVSDVTFVSSNRWDVAAGVRFGFRCVWINRTGQPDEYADLQPALTLPGLAGLISA